MGTSEFHYRHKCRDLANADRYISRYLLTGYVTHRKDEFALELVDRTASVAYKKNINGFDIKLGSNYNLMSQIPDYGVNLKISNTF